MNNIVFAGKRNKEFENNVHGHNCWEIICCNQRGELICEKQKINYKKGDVLVIPPLVKHKNFGAYTGDLFILIEQALLPFKQTTALADEDEAIYYACNVAAERFLQGETQSGVLSALGGLIVAYLCEKSAKTFSPVVQSVCQNIAKNLSNSSYSLEDFLRSLPLNYDYVRKLFKKETGITPHEYLTKSRMELAKSVINSGITNKYSNYSVSQIAETCGYSEPLYFSRVFKKYYGVSPSVYAKNKQ